MDNDMKPVPPVQAVELTETVDEVEALQSADPIKPESFQVFQGICQPADAVGASVPHVELEVDEVATDPKPEAGVTVEVLCDDAAVGVTGEPKVSSPMMARDTAVAPTRPTTKCESKA